MRTIFIFILMVSTLLLLSLTIRDCYVCEGFTIPNELKSFNPNFNYSSVLLDKNMKPFSDEYRNYCILRTLNKLNTINGDECAGDEVKNMKRAEQITLSFDNYNDIDGTKIMKSFGLETYSANPKKNYNLLKNFVKRYYK